MFDCIFNTLLYNSIYHTIVGIYFILLLPLKFTIDDNIVTVNVIKL